MAKDVIIVISGKIGSGKDTVANIIAGYCAREAKLTRHKIVKVIRFADPIKRAIAAMDEYPLDFLNYDSNKALNSNFICKAQGSGYGYEYITYGKLQQEFGDAMRDIYEDIFADMVISKIASSEGELIIIPDLRFPNELNKLLVAKELNSNKKFIFIKLIGRYTEKIEDKRSLNHISEKSVDELEIEKFDYILNCNTYDKEYMKHTIKQILVFNNIL